MEITLVAIFVMLSVMFLLIGGIIGWLYQQHQFYTATPALHPEMFDVNGNVIPDEILAVRFENNYADYEEIDDAET